MAYAVFADGDYHECCVHGNNKEEYITIVPFNIVYIEPGYSFSAIQAAMDNPAVSEIVLLPGVHRAGTPESRFGTGLRIERSDLIFRGYDDSVVINLDNVWGRHVIMAAASFDWDTQCCCEGDSGVPNSNIVIRDIIFQGEITNTGTHPNSPVIISADGIHGLTIENITIDTVTTNNFIHDPVGGIWIRNSEDVVIRSLDLSAVLPTQGATVPPFPPMPVILLDAGDSWYAVDATLRNITIEDVIWPSQPHNPIELWVRNPEYFAEVDLASISLAGFPYIEFIGPAVWMGNGNWWDRQGDHAVFRATYDETWDSNHDLLELREGNERNFYFHPGSGDIHVAVSLEIVVCEDTNTFTIEQVLPDLDLLSDGGRLELVFSFNGDDPRGSVLYFDGTPIPIPTGTTDIHAIGRVTFDHLPHPVYMRKEVIRNLLIVSYEIAGTNFPADFNPASLPASVIYHYGTTDITVAPVPTTTETMHDGLTGIWAFNGWTTASPGVANQNTLTNQNSNITGGTFAMPNNSVHFTGYWTFTPNQSFDVTYEIDGDAPATVANMPITSQAHQAGATVTVAGYPTTTSTLGPDGVTLGSWTFDGWDVASTTFVMPSNDVVITGTWTFTPPDQYQVIFILNSGIFNDSAASISHNFNPGELVGLNNVPVPTRTGYELLGWRYDGQAAGTPNLTRTGVAAWAVSGNRTFTAQWQYSGGGDNGGNGNDPTPNPAVQITKSAPATVQPNTPLTYTITVRNTGNVTLTDLVVTDNLPEALQNPRNLQYPANVTAFFTGQTLNATIASISPGQFVTISFVATVNAAVGQAITNTATAQVPSMLGVSDEDSTTTTVTIEQPEMIKNPDKTVVSVGETVNWTLRGFHNRSGHEVFNFSIIDMPSRGLNFLSGSLPAFNNGAGITFDIMYTVYGSNEWRTHATGIDASRPFEFTLPQPGDLYYTNIELLFGNVPADFGLGNEIVMTFIVGEDAPNNTLVNRFIVRYGNVERECRGSGVVTVTPDVPGDGDDNDNLLIPGDAQLTTSGQPGDVDPSYIIQTPIVGEQLQIVYEPDGDTDIDINQRRNPQTSDNFNRAGIFLSLGGIVISLGALLLIVKSKKKTA